MVTGAGVCTTGGSGCGSGRGDSSFLELLLMLMITVDALWQPEVTAVAGSAVPRRVSVVCGVV